MILKLWSVVVLPLFYLIALFRFLVGKEKKAYVAQRFGWGVIRPIGSVFWMHAASLGEAKMALDIIDILKKKEPSLSFLLTVQSLSAMEGLVFPEKVIAQMVPFDHPFFVKRFLNHWKPMFFLVFEAECWPVLWSLSKYLPRGVLNFHMSYKSFIFWQHFKVFWRFLYDDMMFITCSCQNSARLFKKLSSYPLKITPSLKYLKKQEQKKVLQKPCAKPFVLISCLHEWEEDLFLSIETITPLYPDLVWIWAPRQRVRFRPWRKKIRGVFWSEYHLHPNAQHVVIDQLGILDQFYNAAECVILAGSFVKGLKGHSLIEPSFYNRYVIFGPHMENQEDLVKDFRGVHKQISVQGLWGEVKRYLDDSLDRKSLNTKDKLEEKRYFLEGIIRDLFGFVEEK